MNMDNLPEGKWVAIANGIVQAIGDSEYSTYTEAMKKDSVIVPFVCKVGSLEALAPLRSKRRRRLPNFS
jgi:hypothetical protein